MSKGKPQRTLVTLLLDRSASMQSVHAQTVSAYNEYVDGLRRSKAPIEFTFLQFDTQSLDKVFVAEPIAKIPVMKDSDFQPRGATPLIDSAYATIKAVEGQEKAKGAKIVICIQTDGEENSSMKHNWEELKSLIAKKTKDGWQFNFMGCGIDAYQQSARMGLTAGQTVSYSPDMASTRAAFAAQASNTVSYAAGAVMDTSFLASQKAASGDKFDPNLNLHQGTFTGINPSPVVTTGLSLNDDKGKDFSL